MDYKDLQAGNNEENFWFKSKRNLLHGLTLKLSGNKTNIKILHAGAGTGDLLTLLGNFDNYVADIDKNALSLINKKTCKEKIIADICKLPYKDNFFDLVICSDVLEHIEDDETAASELYRVLKKGGKLIFTVPAFQSLYSSHDAALSHKRRYSKRRLNKILFPFEKIRIFYWNSVLFIPISILRMIKKNSPPEVDNANLPSMLNSLFTFFLHLDNLLITHNLSLPFGLSLAGFSEK